MRIDQSTGGSKLINELRTKLATEFYAGGSTNELRPKGSGNGPWERMRLFYKLNQNYVKFCQATLAEVTSEYQGITMELGDIFRSYRSLDRQAIGFKLISHEFSPIYMRLRETLAGAVEDSMKNPSTCAWRRKLKAERNVEYWNVKVVKPTVFLGTVPTHDADQVVKNLAVQYGGQFWTVKVIGLHLGYDSRSDITRDPNFVQKFQEFPFKGSL
jgi:hypothetical protein